MNKITKGLLAGAVVVSLFATMGCGGGDKKKEEPKPATTTTTQKQDKAPEVKQTKVKPVPKSSMYRYALHLDDVNKLPPMTDEVIKEFEKQAKPIKIAEKDPKKHRAGIWTFNSAPQRKGAQVYTYRWTAELDGHHDSEFTNDKGKKINEQHFAHIEMTTDGKTEKLRSVRVVKYHVTKETGEKGKLEELYKQTYK
jgi:type IV secretory pathway VirB10-like protein